MNSKLGQMIKNNERGDQISYAKFGQEIFKQVEEKEGLNPNYMKSSSPLKLEYREFNQFKNRISDNDYNGMY
jgi:hypothetical protein